MKPSQPSRILILALGSRGDVLPYVTLAGALQQAGQQVLVATFAFFEDVVDAAGVELLPVPGDAEGLIQQAADGLLGASAPTLANPIAIFRAFQALRRSYGQLTRHLPQTLNEPRLFDTTLVLNQLPAYLFGEDIAEMLSRRVGRRIPSAILSVIPTYRTAHQPLLGFRALPAGLPQGLRRAYNLWTYRLGEQMGWQMFRRSVNGWRRLNGLAPQPFWGRYKAMFSPPPPGQPDTRPPIVCGFSEKVVARPPDWDSQVQMTGWWWPETTHWYNPHSHTPLPAKHANPALEQFLAAGPPPVFIGLGSMPVPDPARASALFIEAAKQANVRLLLHSGWAGLAIPPDMAENVFSIQYAPYDWLFPQMGMVIHHGGSGTTGYALASGVPSMVLPFVFDQFYWGERSAALGVGPEPIPFSRLTALALAAAIREVSETPTYRQAATALAQTLRAENGVERAVDRILRLPTRIPLL